MDQIIKIELFGQKYTFKTDIDSERAQKVADYLKNHVEKVKDLQVPASIDMKKTILILAALNIADEKFELKANYDSLLNEIAIRNAELIKLLDM